MHQAGLNVTEFSASYGSSSTPDEARHAMEGYIEWIENLPLFQQIVELGWVDQSTLEGIKAGMRQWAEHPDAFLATARCEAVGGKD